LRFGLGNDSLKSKLNWGDEGVRDFMARKRQSINLERVAFDCRNCDVNEVALVGAMFQCTKCGSLKPASEFGLRFTKQDGVVRNQPQCSKCR